MKKTILAAMLVLAVPGLANADSGKLPDLVVSDITWSTENDGVDYTIVAAVKNVGKKLTGPATIEVVFEGQAVGSHNTET